MKNFGTKGLKRAGILAVLLLCIAGAAFGQKETDYEITQLPDNTVKITKFKQSEPLSSLAGRWNVVIPETLYGLKVTVIGEGAFRGKGINSVVIPDSVTVIEARAFYALKTEDPYGSESLKSITLGKNLVTIGSQAFAENPRLTTLVIPDSVTSIEGGGSSYVDFYEGAFYGCGLSSITWGKGLTSIGDFAFAENKLKTLTLPESVTYIGSGAFEGNQLTSLSIPKNVTAIGPEAFKGNPITTLVLLGTFQYQGAYEYGPFSGLPLTRITLPADMEIYNDSEQNPGFEQNFINYWINQNKQGGTYIKRGPIWTRE